MVHVISDSHGILQLIPFGIPLVSRVPVKWTGSWILGRSVNHARRHHPGGSISCFGLDASFQKLLTSYLSLTVTAIRGVFWSYGLDRWSRGIIVFFGKADRRAVPVHGLDSFIVSRFKVSFLVPQRILHFLTRASDRWFE